MASDPPGPPLRRSIGLVVLGVAVGLIPVFLRDGDTASPEPAYGTVIWSNQETRRILFEPEDKPSEQREILVVAAHWQDEQGQGHGRGYPGCLTADGTTDPVRTDRRKVEIATIRIDDDETQMPELAVTVRCLG